MLTPAFHFSILKDFVEIMNQKADILIQKLSAKPEGEVFDVYRMIALCALDIIMGKMCRKVLTSYREKFSCLQLNTKAKVRVLETVLIENRAFTRLFQLY